MPKRSRRLPGGRTRKLRKAGRARPAAAAPRADRAGFTGAAADGVSTVTARAGGGSLSLGGGAVAQPTRGARARPPPSPWAVQPAEARSRGPVPGRMRPSQLDAVAAGYAHVRGDLARIGLLAGAMLALLVALSFVIR